jgi:hypothetical protein
LSRLRNSIVVVLAVFSLLALGTASGKGSIAGTVCDDRGAQLSGALVEVAGSPAKRSAVSGGLGFFYFSDMPAGEYTITVTHPNFAPAEERVVIHSGDTVKIGVQLLAPRRR